jgi:glutamine cyclotransferase
MRYILLLSIGMVLNWIISCSGSPDRKPATGSEEAKATAVEEPAKKIIRLVAPEENEELSLHSGFRLAYSAESKNNPPDSVKIWFDSKQVSVLKNNQSEFQVPSSLVTKTGRKSLKVVAFINGSAVQTITRFLVVYSDTPPGRNGYRVIKQYEHDRGAFTQGLVYHGGLLYEGTGQESRSSLRKVKLETGEVLSQLNLESQLFGEGIAISGEKIYQLTWQSKVGFVYDLASFRLISKFYYQTEGWGLTAMGDDLVMSDGSNILYIVEPQSFNVIGQIEVYDNKAKVGQLNELEFINGEIWANIWQTDLIARIEPSSGKVIAYVDLKGILKDPQTDTGVDVLNGIAYDNATRRIFVTGKNWPRLFEIRITE